MPGSGANGLFENAVLLRSFPERKKQNALATGAELRYTACVHYNEIGNEG